MTGLPLALAAALVGQTTVTTMPPVAAPPAHEAPAPDTPRPEAPAPAVPEIAAPATPAGEGIAPISPPSAPASSAPAPETDAIVVTGEAAPPGDPLSRANETSFEAVQAVDKAVIGPVARGYRKSLPGPVRSGVRNFLRNLDEPVVFLNFLLQLKPGKALETLARFSVNTTLGVAGVVDVAKRKPFHLPRRSNGLANTLGYYGVKPGPYLYLPIIGSTTARDLFGRLVDLSVVPLAVGKPFNSPVFAATRGTISSLDERAENDEHIEDIRENRSNPYAAMREYYLQKRADEIDVLRGRLPDPLDDDAPVPSADPAGDTTPSAPPVDEPPAVPPPSAESQPAL